MPLLELTDVFARYGPIRALHGVSLKVDEGEVVAVLGANGAGKTTTLRSISGMTRTVRRDHLRRPPHRPQVDRIGRAARHRPCPGGPGPLPRADRLGEPADGRRRPARRLRRGGRADRRATSPGSSGAATRRPPRSAAASSRCSHLAARSSPARACSCSTSRRSGSRRPSSASCSRSFATQRGRRADRARRRAERDGSRSRSRPAPTCSRSGKVAVEGTSDELARHEGVRKSYLGY